MTAWVLAALFLSGFTRSEAWTAGGDLHRALSPYDQGMAGALFFEPSLHAKNPAALLTRTGWFVQAGLEYGAYREAWRTYVYDRFDQTIGQATLYSRMNSALGPGLVSLAYSTGRWGVGVSYDPVRDFSYEMQRVVRLDAYTEVEGFTEQATGSLGRYQVSAAYGLGSFSLGLGLRYYQGSRDQTSDHWTADGGRETTHEAWTFQGMDFQAGMTYRLGYRLKLAVVQNLGRVWSREDGTALTWVPRETDLAVELVPLLKVPSRVAFAVRRECHFAREDSLFARWVFALGIAHDLPLGTRFTMGAQLRRLESRKIWVPVYAFGVQQVLGRGLYGQFGLAIQPVQYSEWVPFETQEPQNFSVEEVLTRVSVGLLYRH